MLDCFEIILDYIDKMKDQGIVIGDLNISFLKSDRNKEKLEVLLNMFDLQAIINVPTRIYEKTNSAIDQIILNPELRGFKTEVLETTLSHHFGQILPVDHDSLPGKNFKQNKAIYKYIRVTNDRNIKYLNYLLLGENWENVYQQHDIDTAYKECLQTLAYYFDTAVRLRKVSINKQIKNQWITPGIYKSSERLTFLSRYIKEKMC
jgi:hypothetical protein